MSNLTVLKQTPRLPSDAAAQLRKIADSIDAGETTELCAAMVTNGSYEFLFVSSLTDSLVLASLLQHRCVERFSG